MTDCAYNPPINESCEECPNKSCEFYPKQLIAIEMIETKILEKQKAMEPVLTFDGLTLQEFTGRELFEFQEATGCNTADEYREKHPISSIPEGWQLVPVVPTEAMLNSANREMGGSGSWISCYRAMLAAASKVKP